MATTTDDLLIRIELEAGKARQGIDGLRKDLDKLNKTTGQNSDVISNLGKDFLKTTGIVYLATKALDVLTDTLIGGISAFIDASDAVTIMNHALEIAGNTTIKQTTEQFIKLGDSIQSFGVASTENVLKLSKIGIAAGHSAEEVEKLVKTAADLSVAREIPLDVAFKSLSATLKGSVTGLSSFIPELKNLTEEQLKAGKAIEYVSLQLGGFAAKNLETFSGKLNVLKEILEDVGETFAQMLFEIFDVKGGLDDISNALQAFNGFLQESKLNIVAFGQTIKSYLIDIWDFATAQINKYLSTFQQVIGSVIYGFGQLQLITDKWGKRNTDWANKVIEFGESQLEASAKNKLAYENWANGIKEVTVATDTAKKSTADYVKKSAEAKKALQAILADSALEEKTKESSKVIDELIKKIQDLETANAAAGKTGEAAIKAKFQADIKEIDNIKKKIDGYGALNSEVQSLVDKASKMISSQESAEIEKYRADILKQINEKNLEIETNIKSFNATKREQIEFELQAQLDLIKLKREQIAIEDKASQAALDRQEELLKKRASQQTQQLPSGPAESLIKGGESVANSITGAFSSGALSMIGAAASAVGMIVTAANAVLDMIPNMINGIAGVFNKLTDFPNVLFNAFQNLFNGVINFVSNFIPNILQFIPKFIEGLADFIDGFINAFKELLAKIPEIVFSILDKLPALVERLVASLVASFDELLESFVTFLVTKGPELFLRVMKAIYIDLPIAIVKGIWKGIVRIAEVFKRIFSGKSLKLPKVQVDTKSAQKAASNFAGSASRVFKVDELTDSVKDNMQKITDNVRNAFKKGVDWIKQAWNWVNEKIIMPIYNFLRDAWLWVYDNIITPLIDGIKAVWNWINENIITPLIDGIKAVWNWINDNIITPLIDGITAAWQWIYDNLIKPFIDAYLAMWKWIDENIISPFIDGVKAIWKWVDENIISPFIDGIKAIWNFVYKNIMKPFIDAYLGMWKWIWDNIISPFVDGIRAIWDWVYENVMKPFIDAYLGMWEWIWDNIISPFVDGIKAVWEWVDKNIISPLVDGIKSAFNWVNDNVLKPISELGKDLAQPLVDAFDGLKNMFSILGDLFSSIFKLDFSGVQDAVKKAFDAGADIFRKAFKAIVNPLITVFNLFIDMINGLKIPEIGWSISAGSLGKWSGTLIPEIDLVPGEIENIKKLAKGGFIESGFGTDTVPAMLTPGEFVVNRRGVEAGGLDLLNNLNRGQVQGNNPITVNIEVNVDAKMAMDEGYIRGKLIPTMTDELRRASLDGKFIISSKGIR